MRLFVLDTDHVSLLQRAHSTVVARVLATPPAQLAVSVITFEEQPGAWYTQIRKARDPDKLARPYAGLLQILDDAKRLCILPFSKPAIDRYCQLRRLHWRVGRMDRAIAAIVIEHGAVLVTRNRSDFEPIEGLALEDRSRTEWPGTKSPPLFRPFRVFALSPFRDLSRKGRFLTQKRTNAGSSARVFSPTVRRP